MYGGPLVVTGAVIALERARLVSSDDPESLGRLRVAVSGAHGPRETWAMPTLALLVGKEVAARPGEQVWLTCAEPPVVLGRCVE